MAKKLKVLHVLYSLSSGGAESFILNVYRNIDKDKVRFDFLLRSDGSNEKYLEEVKKMGSKVYITSSYPRHLLKNTIEVNEIIKNGNYDVVHVHANSLIYVTPLILAKKYQVRCRILHSHNSTTAFGIACKAVHYFNRNFIDMFVTHKFACGRLAGKWMFGNRKFKIVSNAIEIEKFMFDESKRNKKRRELGIEDNFIVGMVGRLTVQKNHQFMLKVFREFVKRYNDEEKDKHKNKDMNKEVQSGKKQPVLLLVGDGELRGSLEQMAKEYGIEKNVIFAGQREDVEELLMAMDLFVLPSFYEGFPFALVEAQVSGLLCLVSDTVTDEVKLSQNIEYIPISSETIWGDKMMDICGSGEKYGRMIEKKVFSRYDIYYLSKAVLKFYEHF